MVSEAEELQETRERSGIGIPLFGVPLATSPIPPSLAPFSTEKEEVLESCYIEKELSIL